MLWMQVFLRCRNISRGKSSLIPLKSFIRTQSTLSTVASTRIQRWISAYEDILGLSEVKIAQQRVIDAEGKFLEAQEKRRTLQLEIQQVREKLSQIRADMDKLQRGDDRHLSLFTAEHDFVKRENRLLDHLRLCEGEERNHFGFLSAALRESHEKERTRTERTRYWSIALSLTSALIGILGTMVAHHLRLRDLRQVVNESSNNREALQLIHNVQTQQNEVQRFLDELKGSLGLQAIVPAGATPTAEDGSEKELLIRMRDHEERVLHDLGELKALVAGSSSGPDNVVYVGPEVEELLKRTEENIEQRMKLYGLATVTALYSGLCVVAVGGYFLFQYLRGS